MRRLFRVLFLLLGISYLVGCDESVQLGVPQLTTADFTALPPVTSTFIAEFDPSAGVLPFPSNLLFTGTTDGTLNIPIEGSVNPALNSDPANDYANPKVVLNALDGFSTVAPLSATFTRDVDPATVTPSSVRLYEVSLSAEGAVTAVTGSLTYGVDYLPAASGSSIGILLLKPLKPQSSYMVALSSALKSTAAAGADSVISSSTYLLAKRSEPLVDSAGYSLEAGLSNNEARTLEGLRQLVNIQETQLAAQGLPSDQVVLSWTFTTQSVGKVLAEAQRLASGAALISPNSIGKTSDLLPGTAGISDIYVGTLTLPYYLQNTTDNPYGPLQSFWRGVAGSHLTAYNSTPIKYVDATIPLLVSVPNAGSGHSKPASGWPVVIFQHGITSNRLAMLAIADSFSKAGFASVAIDLPLHGVSPDSPLHTDFERTFDVDYVTQDPTTGAVIGQAPDQVVDSSGRHFINLASLLTSRDNVRQSVADLFALRKALDTMDYDAGGADFDTSQIRFVGHSLGGMVGTPFLALQGDVGASVLAMPGGGIAKLLDGSPAFGPEIAAGLALSAGLQRGSADYESFMAVAQTALDSADPINYAAAATSGRGLLLLEVVGGVSSPADQVIGNHVGTLANGFMDVPFADMAPGPLSGTDPLATAMALPILTASATAPAQLAWLRFVSGDHASLLSPVSDPLVTTAMQTAAASFVASSGASVVVTDTSLVK